MSLAHVLAVVFLSMASTGLRAGTAGIQDNAGFFSDTARADAGFNINELKRTQGKDLRIETIKEIPSDVSRGVNLQDKAATGRMFEQWAKSRAREQNVNGVYILLVKEPAHLQVAVGNETQKQAFTLADRDALVSKMLAKLKIRDNDAALREGVGFVASTMKNHASPRNQRAPAAPAQTGYRGNASAESSGGWLLPVLLIGLVIWVVLGIFRSLARGGMSGGGLSPGNSVGGGGGFFRNMLGGMFGAAAGMWMYDTFFGSHGTSAHASTFDDQPLAGGSDPGSGFSGQDTDYSSSGGSFGDDSGSGGFFGGGDSGGGFDGGGDFGGGGDSGGGGGDF